MSFINSDAKTYFGMLGTSNRQTIFSGKNALYDPQMEKDMSRAGSRVGPGPAYKNIFE